MGRLFWQSSVLQDVLTNARNQELWEIRFRNIYTVYIYIGNHNSFACQLQQRKQKVQCMVTILQNRFATFVFCKLSNLSC